MKQNIDLVRQTLSSLLTSEASKEQTDAIISANKALDDIVAEQEANRNELASFKQDYIDLVKSTGFRVDSNPLDEDISGQKEVSFEDCLRMCRDK